MGYVPTHGPWCTKIHAFRTLCRDCHARVVYFECSCGSKVLFDPPHGGVHNCWGSGAVRPSGVIASGLGASDHCRCCGRALTHPVSRQLGVGPVCAGHLGIYWWQPMKVVNLDALPWDPSIPEPVALESPSADAARLMPGSALPRPQDSGQECEYCGKRGRWSRTGENGFYCSERCEFKSQKASCRICGRPCRKSRLKAFGSFWRKEGYYCSPRCEALEFERRWG